MPENTEESAHFRTALRQQLLSKRAARTHVEHAANAAALIAHLQTWLTHDCAPSIRDIGFCLPTQGECDLTALVTELVGLGWHVSVPVVEQRAAPMIFRHWTPSSAMTHDRHGIAIPDTAACAPPALLLIPVVGVDVRGFRLGYGGGYFDRTLADLTARGMRPLCVGVGFECARIETIHPAAHDEQLDLLVTECGLQPFD
jgi:5-formyltetrahydrofolate cyclo-ligase